MAETCPNCGETGFAVYGDTEARCLACSTPPAPAETERIILCETPRPEVGSAPPDGYLARHEWARRQIAAGLRQRQHKCGLWLFPQEEADHVCPM